MFLKKLVPKPIKKVLIRSYNMLRFRYHLFYNKYFIAKKIKNVQKKDIIKVVFLVIHRSVWKHDYLYRLLSKDPRFEPLLVICPYTTTDEVSMIKELNDTYSLFKKTGYDVVNTLNEELNWIDLKAEVNPDLVFFTNPHPVTFDRYHINNFHKFLTCYVPYTFVLMNPVDLHYDKNFHNLLWKHFVETEYHFKLSSEFSKVKNKNVVVTGYPGLDPFFDDNYQSEEVWNQKSYNKTRIIWAPHHSIEEDENGQKYSTFLRYHNFFFDLVATFKDLHIAFKPHPILKSKLYEHPDWGKKRTDDYYDRWENFSSGQLEEGHYIDLFIQSDALIHDSSSFMAEYACTQNPILFLKRDEKVRNRINAFGQKLFDLHYHANNKNQIISFIEEVVMNKEDLKRAERITFVNQNIKPSNGRLASENIYQELKEKLNKS